MKKIIFTVIILAVLLLFSGCDAMLEFFYPEFAENNVVIIDIEVTLEDLLTNPGYSSEPLRVEIYELGEYPIANIPLRSSLVYDDPNTQRSFFDIPEGSYEIWIWQDTNASGSLNTNDFMLSDFYVPTFTLTGSDDEYNFLATEWALF